MTTNSQPTTRVDPAGTVYQPPAPGPAPAGTQVTVFTPNGPASGHLVGGGYVVTDKK